MLQHALRHCHRSMNAAIEDTAGTSARHVMPYEEAARCQPWFPSLDMVKAELNEADYSMSLDLNPYINTAVYTVPENATMRRAYLLFRTMGLRHMPVVDEEGCIAG